MPVKGTLVTLQSDREALGTGKKLPVASLEVHGLPSLCCAFLYQSQALPSVPAPDTAGDKQAP